MQQSGMLLRTAVPGVGQVPSDKVPWGLRFLGKLVIEVLPAALASAIGAFLFAHYQFAQPAPVAGTAAASAPASSQMLQLVREEHDMIHDFLVAEQAAEKSRGADVTTTVAAADAKPAIQATSHVAAAATDKASTRVKPTVVAGLAPNGGTSTAMAQLPQVLVVSAQPGASVAPPPPPAHTSIVGETLAVPGHVVSMTLHAVMSIGGIPSWIGHRIGAADLDTEGLPTGTAS
jgi:hypothetical protein